MSAVHWDEVEVYIKNEVGLGGAPREPHFLTVIGLAEHREFGAILAVVALYWKRFFDLELIKKLRSMPDYKFAPIVMLTTESQESKRQQGKVAGATGWIVKPFNPEQLLTIVKKVLG